MFRGLNSLPNALVFEDYDVDLWSYRTYCELAYVGNLRSLPTEGLNAWRGWYVVHRDPICCGKAKIIS